MDDLKLPCLLAAICHAPLAITNIFYYCRVQSAVNISQYLHISIKHWLGIGGMFEIWYVSCALMTILYVCCSQQKNNFLYLMALCMKTFHAIYQILWLVFGGLLHWKDKLTAKDSQSLAKYLDIILILQYGLLGIELFLYYLLRVKQRRELKKKDSESESKSESDSDEMSKNQLNQQQPKKPQIDDSQF